MDSEYMTMRLYGLDDLPQLVMRMRVEVAHACGFPIENCAVLVRKVVGILRQ